MCDKERRQNPRISFDDFTKLANKIHNFKYAYIKGIIYLLTAKIM